MSEINYYFDLNERSIIVGEQAAIDSLERGVHIKDLVPFSELGSVELESIMHNSEHLDVDDWDRQDYIVYGKWLLSASQTPLTHRLLHNAYVLGIGPEPQRIYRKDRATSKPRFNGYREFYKIVGSDESMMKGSFDSWDFSKSLKYVRTIADNSARNGIRPTTKHFEELAAESKIPKRETLLRTAGTSYAKLLDMCGYPRPKIWEIEDFLEWGLKYYETNNGKLPDLSGIQELSKKFRGPSASSVTRRFGGIWSFQNAVETEVKKRESVMADMQSIKQRAVEDEINRGLVPEFIQNHNDEITKNKLFSRLLIVRRLFPSIDEPTFEKILAIEKDNDFITRIIQKSKSSRADIETLALRLGIFEDLWPSDTSYLEYMRTTTTES